MDIVQRILQGLKFNHGLRQPVVSVQVATKEGIYLYLSLYLYIYRSISIYLYLYISISIYLYIYIYMYIYISLSQTYNSNVQRSTHRPPATFYLVISQAPDMPEKMTSRCGKGVFRNRNEQYDEQYLQSNSKAILGFSCRSPSAKLTKSNQNPRQYFSSQLAA